MIQAHVEIEPLDANALSLLGLCCLRLNDYEQACQCFAESEAVGGLKVDNRRHWAEALFETGKADEARALLLSSIDHDAKQWRYYWDYAAMVESAQHHDALNQRWRNLLASPFVITDAIERAVAKSATLVGDFELSYAIYRRLIAYQVKKVVAAVGRAPGVPISVPTKPKANDLSGGKGEECLRDFKETLDAENVEFFLMAGTVLGYIRDGALLPGDKDVDIGVFEQHYKKDRIEDILRLSGKFRVTRIDDHADRIRAIHLNGVWVDVFPHFNEDGRLWHAGSVARWWHPQFELKEYSVDGTSFMIPADPEAYLEWNYGPSWRIPDALFDVYEDAPNVEIVHQEFLRYSTWRKTFEGLKARNWPKVLKYLEKDPQLIASNPWLSSLQIIASEQNRLLQDQLLKEAAENGQSSVR